MTMKTCNSKVGTLLPASRRRTGATNPVTIGNVTIGGPEIAILAGPCAVESNYPEHAVAVAATGAAVLRGCIRKPRTSPTSFQGLGEEGLSLLDDARRLTGLPVLSEPLSADDIELLAPHVDALLIGARSMQNTPLLRAAGRSGLPVVLKRGLAATYDEWLGAAEYILEGGNDQVLLCERGIRTFETTTRNTLDVAAVPVLRERTSLPIIVDPSHAAGQARWVPSLALAAVAAGADGLLIECHPFPADSWSDAAQAVTPTTLRSLINAVAFLASAVRPPATATLEECRSTIDSIDRSVAQLVDHRAAVVRTVHTLKNELQLPTRDHEREWNVVHNAAAVMPTLGPRGAELIMGAIIDACLEALP
jgi:3-deoxy-7-phosphoheptulonate synthase